ncbi:Delta 4,5-hexuronate-2-O-sulfatase [Alphaproteobacteria bacterium SO-S41]|nr:Delta 4,5-hexuronate-2-O-sulfatase [Alphaproteobacteria bacterium SO-S41]
MGSSSKPNILMIVTDQECGLSSFPAGFLSRLPGHAKLLERGLHVRNYQVHTTPCSPSRSNIYTGQHTQLTGIYENTNTTASATLPVDMPTVGTMLRTAGYRTIYKGKWHLSSINGVRNWNREVRPTYPATHNALEAYGFSDYFFDGEEVGLTWGGFQTDHVVAADACRMIETLSESGDQAPWFMAVNLVNPHDIMFYDATGHQSETRAAPDRVGLMSREPTTPLYAEDLGYDLPVSFYKDDLSTKPEMQRAIAQWETPLYGTLPRADEASWKRFINYYYNCIRDVDRHIETLLWALETFGQLENTIILFTADHGERGGAHGLRQKGGTIYKEEINVPMIIAHPDGPRGAETDGLMGAVDIAPTLLGLAGLSTAQQQSAFPALKGVDVSALVSAPSAKTARDARGHLYNLGVIYNWAMGPESRPGKPVYDLTKRRLHRGVFDGRYKFARYFAPAQHHIPETWEELTGKNDLELYDTSADPHEIDNLARAPEAMKHVLMRCNAMTSALIATEIGADMGQEYPGPVSQYTAMDAA